MKKTTIIICGAIAASTGIIFGAHAMFFSKWHVNAKPAIQMYTSTDMRWQCGQIPFGEQVIVLEEKEIFKRDYINHQNHTFKVCKTKSNNNEGWIYKNLLSHFKK